MDATAFARCSRERPLSTAEHLRALLDARSLEQCRSYRISRAADARLSQLSPTRRRCRPTCDGSELSGARCSSMVSRTILRRLRRSRARRPYCLCSETWASSADCRLAMVGSRNPTPGGRATALDFAAQLAAGRTDDHERPRCWNRCCESRGALSARRRTIAVCGTGLDAVYPRQHAALAARIRERGALVSEFPPRTRRRAARIFRSAIASSAAFRSAHWWSRPRSQRLAHHGDMGAPEQGREVFAIPGSIHNPLARGCHELIRDGAQAGRDAAEVLSELEISLSARDLRAETSGRWRRLRRIGQGV